MTRVCPGPITSFLELGFLTAPTPSPHTPDDLGIHHILEATTKEEKSIPLKYHTNLKCARVGAASKERGGARSKNQSFHNQSRFVESPDS